MVIPYIEIPYLGIPSIEIPYIEIPYVEIPYIDIPCVDFPHHHLTHKAIRLSAKPMIFMKCCFSIGKVTFADVANAQQL